MIEEDIFEEIDMEMEGAVDALKRDFKTLRTGKVSTAILDNVRVDYYGALTALSQVATVLAIDATTISVSPWEKNILHDVEKAIQVANIGANPNNDGDIIKLFFPAMTIEQRTEIAKQAKTKAENAKVSVRNHRKAGNDSIKKLEKAKDITEDDSRSGQERVQKLTDKYITMIETTLSDKEKEILSV
jgi:ribosome recycling factor